MHSAQQPIKASLDTQRAAAARFLLTLSHPHILGQRSAHGKRAESDDATLLMDSDDVGALRMRLFYNRHQQRNLACQYRYRRRLSGLRRSCGTYGTYGGSAGPAGSGAVWLDSNGTVVPLDGNPTLLLTSNVAMIDANHYLWAVYGNDGSPTLVFAAMNNQLA